MNFFDISALFPDLVILLKLLIIIALAGFLGWERESAGKAAGIRTHILVGVGAVMFLIIGEILINRYMHLGENLRFDPIRIVEAVVTGISFLGAGTIFVAQGKEAQVKGLTTAASILTTAAVGLIVGLERYFLAVSSTFIIFSVLRFLGYLDTNKFDRSKQNAS